VPKRKKIAPGRQPKAIPRKLLGFAMHLRQDVGRGVPLVNNPAGARGGEFSIHRYERNRNTLSCAEQERGIGLIRTVGGGGFATLGRKIDYPLKNFRRTTVTPLPELCFTIELEGSSCACGGEWYSYIGGKLRSGGRRDLRRLGTTSTLQSPKNVCSVGLEKGPVGKKVPLGKPEEPAKVSPPRKKG